MTAPEDDKAQAFAEACAGLDPPIPGLPAPGCSCHYRIVMVLMSDGTQSPRPGPMVECGPCSAVRLAHQRATCDHVQGVVYWTGENEYLTLSNRAENAAAALEETRRWLEAGYGAPYAVKEALARDTPEKALAARADLFDYCPRCGARNVHP